MKSQISDLAIFGNEPAFAQALHVGRPNIGNRHTFQARLDDMFDRRWLTNNGKYVQQLEATLADYLGVQHFVAINNGTVALEVAIRAANLSGEVIVPSFTFVATAHALQWLGITPIFCDVDPLTHTLDPRRVEELITPRTSAIIGVHVWGYPCAIDALQAIAHKHNLKLMFDAAHAFGCGTQASMIGNFGDAEIFSFHATKFYNTFEGGGIATNDDQLAQRCRQMRNFGFMGYDNVESIGTNGKMAEVCAAMGLANFEKLEQFITVNQRNYEAYARHLNEIDGLRLFHYPTDAPQNYQYIVVEVDETVSGLTRDQLTQVLHAENVLARRYFYPGCHEMEPYRSLQPKAGLILPVTNQLSRRVMTLPNGEAVTPEEIGRIVAILRAAIDQREQVITALNRAAAGVEDER